MGSTSVAGDISARPSLNPNLRPTAPPKADPTELFNRLRLGDRVALARAITLIESEAPAHRTAASELLQKCFDAGDRQRRSLSTRVGITGVPGVGKSTFIDRLGTYLANEQGRNVAVLAIDPSSERSQGSILGDKSRMPGLAISERAFVRPSPTRGYLSGVTRWTQETILVCEAAGYDTILVETVGVGQSEIAIKDMVDTYLLLLLPGAGDELQGMKRGVVEMADILAVTKSDGPNLLAAEVAQTAYRNATHLLPRQPSGWIPEVLRCSAVADDGIAEIWNSVLRHRATLLKGEWFLSQRQGQRVKWFEQEVALQALERLHNQLGENSSHQELVAQVEQGKIPASIAARILVDLLQQAP